MTFAKNNQQKIALAIGYVLVASLFYSLGQFTSHQSATPIAIEEPAIDLTQINNKLNEQTAQSTAPAQEVAGTATAQNDANCTGKIKGNISSSGKIYHLPGGAFYNRTVPELCFDTEVEAQKAGFRKSSR